MASKIRVHELARELGMPNEQVLELCQELSIGVTSPSSSMVDQQADRVRRKAHRQGLVGQSESETAEPEVEEPAEEPKQKPKAEAKSAAKLRVNELSRELGMSNNEVLELCGELGIAVKSHSSGLEAEQVDRVRGEARSRGLVAASEPEAAEPVAAEPESETAEPEVEEPAEEPKQKPKAEAKLRVNELSRELGMSNNEVLELCGELGIAVKSHSSGLEAEQVDRVRGEARSRGLVAASEPEAAEPVAAEPEAESVPVEPEPVEPAEPVAAEPEAEPVQSPVDAPDTPTAGDATPSRSDGTPSPPPQPSPPRQVVTSSGGTLPRQRPPEPPPPPTRPAPPAPDRPRPSQQERPAAAASPAAPEKEAPVSRSGRPIPPPPGVRPPRSSSGKPIPPPPGRGGRGPGAGPSPRRPGRPGGAPAGARPPRSTGAPSRPGTGFGARTGVPMGPPPPGRGGPGAPGGRGGPSRPQQRRRKGRRRRRVAEELQPMDVPTYTPTDAAVPEGEVVLERASTPLEVGPRLNRTASDLVQFLMQQGEMVTATQSLSDEMIELFAADIGATVRLVDPGEEQENELLLLLEVDDEVEVDDSDQPIRPPVITVMGHVDHGKTKLLDQIRNAKVADSEAGGITQHIGAYQVEKSGRQLTFIDTPGHAAFTAMRARGADATDIVVLVVAADDGVMPQTVEAIDHARAADAPIVVAVNKIDRENANPTRTMQQLSEHDLVPESWGGETVTVEISALENMGIDDLLEHLVLVAELEDLRANAEGRAQGVVLESNLDIGRGPVATLLVQQGTLQRGDPVVAGAAWGRVRALLDEHGNQLEQAPPSKPVQVLGLSDVAEAGDPFVVAPNDKVAAKVAETREHSRRLANLGRDAAVIAGGARLEDIFKQIQAGETATLNLIVKADVNGSLEAVVDSLRRLEREEVRLSFIHRGVGGVTANDIQLAAASNATIIGFNVRPDRKAREMAETEKVEIRTYEIIYNLIEDVENAMVGMLAPTFEEVVTGEAEVREVFRVPRVGAVAGCYVLNGVITRGSGVRFLREGSIIWRGTVSSLKRFKDDVREVQSGFECGIGLSDFQDLKQGDIIETFEEQEIERV